MYSILVEDKLSETKKVLDTLAADEPSAVFLMLANAEVWVGEQPVTLDFVVVQDDRSLIVNVMSGDRIVYEQSAWPIHHVVGSGELKHFLKPQGDGGLH